MTSKLRQSNEKYYYDLKRLRTGSLLKDANTYYVVLGFQGKCDFQIEVKGGEGW